MRTKNSLKNIIVGVFSQLLIVAIGFVSRKVFINVLGVEMLGVNGLLTSIISMLSLTELGIGTAIVYNLYKPLAEDDREKIVALVQFFKKTYKIIAGIVLLLGLAIAPFLKVFIKEDINSGLLVAIFFLFLTDTIITYLMAHKRSLISADQKRYVVSYVYTIASVLVSASQITILLLTGNFILFLSVRVLIRITENIVLSKIVDKRYPFIKTKKRFDLDTKIKDNIVTNTKALSLHVLGRYLINGTDNIIISRFIGLGFVGLYSNYFLIINTVTAFTNQFASGVLASFGNMIAVETNDKSHSVFKKANFLNYIIINFASVSMLCLFNPFISMWIGRDVLLSFSVVAVLALNFYIKGTSSVLGAVRSTAGVFRPDRYLHLILAALNLIISISLAKVIGIVGVFIGTLICYIIKEILVLPRIVYNNIFKSSVKQYYLEYARFLATTLVSAGLTLLICNYFIVGDGWGLVAAKLAACIVIPNAVVFMVFRKTEEVKFAWVYIKEFLNRYKKGGADESR